MTVFRKNINLVLVFFKKVFLHFIVFPFEIKCMPTYVPVYVCVCFEIKKICKWMDRKLCMKSKQSYNKYEKYAKLS